MKKTILFGILVLPVFLLSACSDQSQTEILSERYQTYQIQSGTISMTQEFVGTVMPFEYTVLSAKIGGKLISINADQGDYAMQGTLLAKLDGAESLVSYQSASEMKLALQQMKIDTENMFNSQISAMEKRVAQSKSALDLAEITIVDNGQSLSTAGKQIEQAQLAYETALSELENTKLVLDQQEKSLYSNAKNALSQTKILLEDIGVFVDEIFGVSLENYHTDDPYEAYLGAKNSKLKNTTENQREDLARQYEILEPQINTALSIDIFATGGQDQIYQTLQSTELFLDEVRLLLTNVDLVLDDSMAGGALTQTVLNGFIAKNTALQNNLEKSMLTAEGSFLMGVKGSIQAIDSFNKQSSMQIDLLTKKLALMKNEADIATDSISTQADIAQQQYEEALAGLQALKDQKASQLSQIQAQITELDGNQDMASVQLNNTKITSPFEGVVMEKYANLGQVVGPGTPIFTLGSNKTVKVVINIPESEVSNFKLGQTMQIDISSMGKSFTGTVSKIAPLVDINSKKIPIEVKVDNPNQEIKIGAYATAIFDSSALTGLQIPFDFVYYEFGDAFVYTLQGQKTKKTSVDIVDCSNQYCLISADTLSVGDIIVK